MTFLIILLAASVELLVGSFESFRSERWVTDWARWLSRVCARWNWWDGLPAVALTIGLPAAMVAVLFNWLTEGPLLIQLGAGVGLLLLTFGPRDLNREIESYLLTYSSADTDVFPEPRPSFLDAADTESVEADRAVLGAIAVAAHERVFAPLFWFMILGPVGPVLYRMAAVLRSQPRQSEAFSSWSERLHDVLIWAPVRLFVVGLGLAGTLPPTLDAWHSREDFSLRSSETLLRETAVAAVNYDRLEQVIGDDPHVYWVNLMHGLVKRTFTLWLTLLAAMTLVAL